MPVVERKGSRRALNGPRRSIQPKASERRRGCVTLVLVAGYFFFMFVTLNQTFPMGKEPPDSNASPPASSSGRREIRRTRAAFVPDYDANAPINKKFNYTVHANMMHVPKCGGTAFSSVVRRVMCELNYGDATMDCCNPGMCDVWTARSCKCLRGCTGHVPDMKALRNPKYDFHLTLIREPLSRAVSGFFYRCHNPNEDCFKVNPAFCPSGRLRSCQEERNFTRWTFEQYVDTPEYQNIYTRMAGADKFPYKSDVVMNEMHLEKAKENFKKFDLVGLQEAYGATVLAIHYIAGTIPHAVDFQKVRSRPISINFGADKEAKDRYMGMLKDASSDLYRRMTAVHHYDVQLFEFTKQLFCEKIQGMVAEVGDEFWRPDIAPNARAGYLSVCGGTS